MRRIFKIINRDSETCEHDTGVFHSVGLDCDFVESLYRDSILSESGNLEKLVIELEKRG